MEIDDIVKILKSGGVILYPTDTIWGLGCDAMNIEAIKKISEIKNRKKDKSFIILVDTEQRLQQIVDVPPMAWDIIDFSTKPITIVYDNPRGLPKELLAEDGSVGIRLTKDNFCKKLISKLNNPIVSTSANLSGDKSPIKFSDISSSIIDRVDAIADCRKEDISIWTASSVIRVREDGRIKVIRE